MTKPKKSVYISIYKPDFVVQQVLNLNKKRVCNESQHDMLLQDPSWDQNRTKCCINILFSFSSFLLFFFVVNC